MPQRDHGESPEAGEKTQRCPREAPTPERTPRRPKGGSTKPQRRPQGRSRQQPRRLQSGPREDPEKPQRSPKEAPNSREAPSEAPEGPEGPNAGSQAKQAEGSRLPSTSSGWRRLTFSPVHILVGGQLLIGEYLTPSVKSRPQAGRFRDSGYIRAGLTNLGPSRTGRGRGLGPGLSATTPTTSLYRGHRGRLWSEFDQIRANSADVCADVDKHRANSTNSGAMSAEFGQICPQPRRAYEISHRSFLRSPLQSWSTSPEIRRNRRRIGEVRAKLAEIAAESPESGRNRPSNGRVRLNLVEVAAELAEFARKWPRLPPTSPKSLQNHARHLPNSPQSIPRSPELGTAPKCLSTSLKFGRSLRIERLGVDF